MRPLRQRVPDVDDVSAAAGERLTNRVERNRRGPRDSLAFAKQGVERRSFLAGIAAVDDGYFAAANASSLHARIVRAYGLLVLYLYYVITKLCPLRKRLQRGSALIVVRAATANRHTRRTRCCHHAHAPPYHRYNKCSGPAAANITKTAADNQTKPRVAVRRRLRPAARPPRHEVARDVGEQRPVDRI